jgi:hypothetical protein
MTETPGNDTPLKKMHPLQDRLSRNPGDIYSVTDPELDRSGNEAERRLYSPACR